MAILKVTTDATTLEALLTGKARLASWRNWPQTEVLELRDPFQDAVPCWQDGKVWPWTNQPHPLESLAASMGNNNAFRK